MTFLDEVFNQKQVFEKVRGKPAEFIVMSNSFYDDLHANYSGPRFETVGNLKIVVLGVGWNMKFDWELGATVK